MFIFDAPAAPYVGQVATRCFVLYSGEINAGIVNGVSSRSEHIARDTITSLKLVHWNGYVTPAGAETATGGVLTLAASIEYPAGTFTQVKWGAATPIAIPSGNLQVSDAVTVAIPIGATFWVRAFYSNPQGMLYFGSNANPSLGDRLSNNNTDLTMSGTIPNDVPGFCWMPQAIIGTTTKRSFLLVGTSRTGGLHDTADASGDLGTIARSIGPYAAYINAGIPSDTAAAVLASHATRAALAAYCSDVIVDHGVNDNQGTVQATLASLFALFPTKRVYAATPSPDTNGAWTLPDGSDQAVAIDMAALRTYLLGVPAPLVATFDVNALMGLAVNPKKWKAPGYTADGIHETQAANLAIQASGIISNLGIAPLQDRGIMIFVNPLIVEWLG